MSSPSNLYLGIDFSGNFRMWSAGCGRSNVWIAQVEQRASRPAPVGLKCVQELAGDGSPFSRLVRYLRESDFAAAGIDAPFSIPAEYLPANGHSALLEEVASIEPIDGRPFPSAQQFVSCVLSKRQPATKKPLRRTEKYWQDKGVNVRSTLWTGARGGAAMTAACLKLLHEVGRPLWPWQRSERGLLVEVFPAAQLKQWGLPHQGYNRNNEAEAGIRHSIVCALAARIDLGDFRPILEEGADALESLICAFAAIAVKSGDNSEHEDGAIDDEGLIAVRRD
jgi:hypothetical protein